MEYIIETKLCLSAVDLPHFERLGEEVDSEYIFCPEPLVKKDRKDFSETTIRAIQNDWATIKRNYPDSKVIGFIQFSKKNKVRNMEKIERAIRCSLYDGSDGCCLCESDLTQSEQSFLEELEGFLEVIGELEKFLILDMETNEPYKKLEIALKMGIKNIILVAGKYRDNSLWGDLLMNIRVERGKSFVMLSSRMNPQNKKYYLETAQIFGADYVFQGFMHGGSDGEIKNYYLDRVDMTFKEKDNLPSTALLFSDEHFRNFEREFIVGSDDEKSLSRVCSFKEGELYCFENRRTIVLNT